VTQADRPAPLRPSVTVDDRHAPDVRPRHDADPTKAASPPPSAGLLDTPAGFYALLVGYLVVHVVVRVAVSGVLTIDDAREAVLGQTLAWGYQARQPPLYNWLVWPTLRLFGVSVLSLTLVKYALLGVAYVFVYASARRLLPTPRLAALATGSLLLVFPVSWTFHDALTSSRRAPPPSTHSSVSATRTASARTSVSG